MENKSFFNLRLNRSLECFDESVTEVIDIHATVINKRFVQKRKEFSNSEILKLRRLRRKHERRYRKLKTADDLQKYKKNSSLMLEKLLIWQEMSIIAMVCQNIKMIKRKNSNF